MSSVRSSARTLTLTLNLSNETCDYRSWALTLTLITLGAFFSVQGLGAMIAGPPAGEIIALLGVRLAMVGAQGSIALVCTLCALATWLPLLLVLRAVLGASLSLFQVAPPPRAQATYIHYMHMQNRTTKGIQTTLAGHVTCNMHVRGVPSITCAARHLSPVACRSPSRASSFQYLPRALTLHFACDSTAALAWPHRAACMSSFRWHGRASLLPPFQTTSVARQAASL